MDRNRRLGYLSIEYWLGAMGGGDMAQANIIYNLADFLNKIAFGLAIYVAAVATQNNITLFTKPAYAGFFYGFISSPSQANTFPESLESSFSITSSIFCAKFWSKRFSDFTFFRKACLENF